MVMAMILGAGKVAHAQTQVASYAFGKPGTATYERLSFWVKDGQRTDIYYAYGAARKEAKLNYLSKAQLNNKPGFKVRFSNGHVLAIVPEGLLLQVGDAPGKASKSFAWEYEGPVNGIGTFCQSCAADEKEAMRIIRTYYLK
ncbi:MAG: hypothetical protein JWP58_442 [Hymenobacter sp.]|nr:hypothetical protein [Hymenobacter sp.]